MSISVCMPARHGPFYKLTQQSEKIFCPSAGETPWLNIVPCDCKEFKMWWKHIDGHTMRYTFDIIKYCLFCGKNFETGIKPVTNDIEDVLKEVEEKIK